MLIFTSKFGIELQNSNLLRQRADDVPITVQTELVIIGSVSRLSDMHHILQIRNIKIC